MPLTEDANGAGASGRGASFQDLNVQERRNVSMSRRAKLPTAMSFMGQNLHIPTIQAMLHIFNWWTSARSLLHHSLESNEEKKELKEALVNELLIDRSFQFLRKVEGGRFYLLALEEIRTKVGQR